VYVAAREVRRKSNVPFSLQVPYRRRYRVTRDDSVDIGLESARD
jgi:hypothetical protein